MSFFDRLRADRSSARTAKERLKLVLMHDRADLPPARLEALRDDLITVLSRYVEIDTRAMKVSLMSDRDQQRLVADVPLAPPRSRRREAL